MFRNPNSVMRVNTPGDADAIIQKLPSDMGIHRNPRKGTLDAPDRVLEDFTTDHSIMVDEVFPDEFSLEATQDRIAENTESLSSYGKPIVSVGGDHSVSFPVLKILKRKFPDLELVWLDAHLDVKEPVDDHVSHDVVVRELLEHGFSLDEVYFVGITRVDDDEEEFLQGKAANIYGPDELEGFFEDFAGGKTYLSVDIDVLEGAEAPGTGYPDGSLGFDDVESVIERVGPAHADLVEVAPVFDQGDATLKNARKILEALLEAVK